MFPKNIIAANICQTLAIHNPKCFTCICYFLTLTASFQWSYCGCCFVDEAGKAQRWALQPWTPALLAQQMSVPPSFSEDFNEGLVTLVLFLKYFY